MTEPLTDYARIGLVHHMLHESSLERPGEHAATLEALALRPDIETFDCCLPYDEALRARLAETIRGCGKTRIAFAIHMFPFSKFRLASTSGVERAQARMILADMVDQAASIGAAGFVFGSGGPPAAEASEAHHEAFEDTCRWLCSRLRPHGITALLEPFDTDFDKKFLMGSVRRCVELVERIAGDFGNIGIEMDMAHLPLMGESFEEAIATAGPWLKRVHLGNCVMKDSGDRFHGDKHPPVGYPGGEIDVPELARILGALLAAGYLGRSGRGDLVLELRPFPGRSAEESVQDNFSRLRRA